MKKSVLLIVAFLGISTSYIIGYGSGAPSGKTGSPGDGASCASSSCHSGGSTAVSGLISSTIPSSGYIPGNTYTITASISHPTFNKFGFQVSPQNSTGTLMGTLVVTNATQTKLVGSNKYITHKSGGTSGSSNAKTWTFNWTAPTAGSGDVTFYGAFCSSNNNNGKTGDMISVSSLVVSEAMPLTVGIDIVSDPTCWDACDGQVKLNISGGVEPVSIAWNGGLEDTVTNFSNLCVQEYPFRVIEGNGQIHYDTAFINAPIMTPLDLNIIGGDTSFCQGDSAHIIASSGFASYQWSNSNNTNQEHFVKVDGDLWVIGIEANGCLSFSDTLFFIELAVPPTPIITQTGNFLTTDQADGYQWYLNGLPMTNGVNPSLLLTQDGTYMVEVFNSYGCSSFSDDFMVTGFGIGDEQLSQLKVYPNPASDRIKFDPPLSQEVEIQMMDLTGKTLSTELLDMGTNVWNLPVGISKGTYIIRLSNGQKERVMKWIIE